MPESADPVSPSGPMNMSELELLARTHATRLACFLRRRVGNPQDVEDLVQDTLLEAVRCMDQFQGQSRPETWLFGIALNLTRNYHKRAKVRGMYTDFEADAEGVASDAANDPAEIASHRERMFRVATAFETLSGETHRLLQLVIHDNLSYEEAARAMGIPTGTVRSRVSRVRSFLKRTIEADRRAPSIARA